MLNLIVKPSALHSSFLILAMAAIALGGGLQPALAVQPKPKPSQTNSTTKRQPSQVRPVLRLGSRGTAVKQLQNLLRAAKVFAGAIDGDFGPVTQAAVIKFQRSKGLVADGVVGATTWAALHG